MFGWILGNRAKREQFRQSDRSERNAVIRRIVTAAAETTPKSPQRSTAGEVLGPFAVNAGCDDPTKSGDLPRDQVAERAYEIWVRNGRPTGTADRDWQDAMRELTAELAPPP
jgi:Protein of unknown function (DUF2934)